MPFRFTGDGYACGGYGSYAAGNVVLRVKPDGKGIAYGYDADNRLTDITYPTLHAVHFVYDKDGRRTQMTDGTPSPTNWSYDDGLHLTHLNSSRGDVYYDYYLTGPRWHMTAPGVNPSNSTACYTYSYDPGLRLTSLQNPFGETTTFLYNDDGTVQKKTLANGATISYWYYPLTGQMMDLQFGYPALNNSYSHHYEYTPAGSLSLRSESDGGVNTFVYDGMDQLTSEVRTGGVPFSHGYTYDHNGNRLTQTVNGALAQQFSYDGHDKLTGGLNESEGYDANGNLLSQTVGGQTTTFSWDDEDRLTGQQFADGHTDAYTYTGLGMRLTKSDPTGGYSYLADGVSPASPVLTDGRTSFTPGISEYNALGSRFYVADAQGNSRGLLDGGQSAQDGYNWDAFGNSVSRFGTNPTGSAWNEEAGYQSDNDSGLKLLGHRYYDSRTGRFVSQDPGKDGHNWYAYCGNSPADCDDPTGLKQTKPDEDQTQQILDAIQMMRDMGYNTEADETQTMLKQGRLLVDDSNPSGEVAGSSNDLFHISRNNVTIFVFQQTFATNFGTVTPTAKFGDTVGLSATLVHENLHALHQGAAFKMFYPSAIEPHAYGKELRYLHALEKKAKNRGQLAAIQGKIETLAVPTGKSFSDKLRDAASDAADGISNSN